MSSHHLVLRGLLAFSVPLSACRVAAQVPRLELGGGLHGQTVGGTFGTGITLELGVRLGVAGSVAIRPEVGWSYSPNVENDAVSTSGGGIGGPGGYRHLVMLGGSVVLSRAVMDRGQWYVLAGAARIDGWGFEGIRPLRHTVASHLGIGWRPTPAFPRLLAEVRARYAPVWRNAPVRYVSGVLVWAL